MKPLYLALSLCCLSHPALAETLTFATWNLEWQRSAPLSQRQFDECSKIKVADRERLEETHPYRWECKSPAQIADMKAVAAKLNADVIAVQEAESPEALQQIWPKDQYDFYVNMQSPWIQRTGFVVRRSSGLEVGMLGDIRPLGDAFKSHARHGAELPVTIKGMTLKLLSVHLKSGCFDRALNSGYATERDKANGVITCDVLRKQAPALESWLDNAIQSGASAMIIGDFNRRFDVAVEHETAPEVSLYAELSDGEPAAARLFRPTKGFEALPECRGGGSKWLIDHALMSNELRKHYVAGSLLEIPVPMKGSDHCPVAFKMKF
ncbi:endonuclease/exonuclease/phosphatase family protein [Pseudomonas sp. B21-056]|jgi:endonuclease/exonuclease/phosphatase family metal-dependent hydrolase|uniref:endonuclease/exonuclease/phosphatase family protein n=1 Tax=Pseudomonas sp. B21-056 TaxID=2895495 RepID=UPI002232B39E|nr:endonuclease/exonuclease/phosphatase family protein [Pseudomonas sp. B21-056]UZE23903.1 endonuclease/exonuclease/phosphatase family protein [Pseudomonas sp. B21-056]